MNLIAITTKDRPTYLKTCLEHFSKYTDLNNCKFVIVDDNSVLCNKKKNKDIIRNSGLQINYIYNKTNLGIAKSKNLCLSRVGECDHIFLLDDDCYPIKRGWENFFVDSGERHLLRLDGAEKMNIKQVAEIGRYKVYDKATGCFMFFKREVIDRIGGFTTEFGKYGFEHADYSARAYFAFEPKKGAYACLEGTRNYIYSMDLDSDEAISTFDKKPVNSKMVEQFDHNIILYSQGKKSLIKLLIH